MAALSTVVEKVRDTTQDEDSDAYRVSNEKMVGFANEFVKELALLRPDLFSTIGEITCADGTVVQVAPDDALILMDIFQVKDGDVVTEVKRSDLDTFDRGWRSAEAAAAENWVRHEKDPRRFFISPPAPEDQILIGQWAELPAAMLGCDPDGVDSDIPDEVHPAYYTAMHHYIVFRIEAKDDESVNSGRARLFYEGFATLCGVGKATKAETEKPEVPSGSQNS